MQNKQHILVVEDEKVISNFLYAILTTNNYGVIKAASGSEAISLAASHGPDLILLDLGLPDMDGLEVLKTIRGWSEVPIIVVSARQHEQEKVEALDAGADDYVIKPFGNSELLARIRTAIRRNAKNSGPAAEATCFQVNGLSIDYAKRRVSVGGRHVHVTPIEYKILVLLSKHAGRVLTHDYIIRQIWGPYSGDNQVLRVNMANIRRNIEENPADPKYIITEVGVGYRMVDESDF